MKVLWQRVTLFLQALLLYNLLIIRCNFKKTCLTPIQAQPASFLACRMFSNSNTQGYPQE
ncbi:hypothetical protein E0L21_01860 [Kosakonia quasisacchari]|uniref:Uncharacterized protein n=1 Tax=Kosakonia quasisacchari TaxID=2529380 RepID=A0A4R0HVA3_9ENTR|nr:hypothetical protein E0L21_01860 [Kosakonia quasisacchari]